VSRAERVGILAFLACALFAIALVVVYFQHPNPQWEGALLGCALGAFGLAFVVVARGLLPEGPAVDHREPFGADRVEEREVEESFERVGVVSRRRFLVTSAGSAIAALAVVAIVPLRGLGPRPGNSLAHSPWRDGSRVVNEAGNPIQASTVEIDSLVTVYPDNAVGSADGQAVLMRVDPALLQLPAGRSDWAPNGIIVFSKVCTHAGCPVGLYEAQRHELLCPCHQSAFAVLRGAVPTSGPAARPLPQLPIAIASDGTLVARGDFSGSVGPGYWDMPQ
jgi:ubiquinol-cytochrome c reductase iron-sulfur subunit